MHEIACPGADVPWLRDNAGDEHLNSRTATECGPCCGSGEDGGIAENSGGASHKTPACKAL